MKASAFDLHPILMKRQDFFGYVIIDDRRVDRVLSDETHRILTQILNHYVAKNKPSQLTCMVEKIRDEIISNSNIHPIAWIYRPYQYANNFCQTEIDGFKLMLKEMREKAEDQILIEYMQWLLEDPFINILLKVRDVKDITFERGLIVKEKVIEQEVLPVPNFSFSLIDPFDHFLWKAFTDDNGCYEFKVIPVSDSEYGKFNYRIRTKNEAIEFDPLSTRKIELVFKGGGPQINLIGVGTHSELLTVCPICDKEILKTTETECQICKTKVCRRCITFEGFFKKRAVCKSCKNKK
ncbi:MAG: hypothetical protein NC925_03365 [Candidatus Omnitrophica bacterium]|nr:hypothetical protein [Candidatus Omnitrophota bacterium]